MSVAIGFVRLGARGEGLPRVIFAEFDCLAHIHVEW
jgi:hypothetical protein